MKIIKLAKDRPEDWDKMVDWFDKRTNKHIGLVEKYCKKAANYDDKFSELIERAKTHDQSKFKDPEKEPYIYISWDYKCKDDGVDFEAPEDMSDRMNEATEHHIKSNEHHPEFHSGQKGSTINREDRDAIPDKMVDATKMKDIDVAEMVCDWMAMSDEKGTNPKDWADKNVNVRWKFTDRQKDIIYDLIDGVWDK